MNGQNNNPGGISATISGPVSGQVAIGNVNRLTQQVSPAPSLTAADLASLQRALQDLKDEIRQKATPETKKAALERVDELEEAIKAGEPHLGTMEYVQRWFLKNLPGLAGTVTSLIVHPVVGKLVEAAGDALAAEFRRRFNPGS
ncbi:MAG TPA: hypothetical protein VLA49_11860 [Anaerolineales bacterium]|nr:hypothetical protein [Anaerolineales bacterium]